MYENRVQEFQDAVWEHYRHNGRSMPWRQPGVDGKFDPYKIMVSEVMLQQTQVARVIPKFEAFVQMFPSVQALAAAPLAEVLRLWSGLGYNRRAKYLHQAATLLVKDYAGEFPATLDTLTKLPGIGINTAGAILVYAHNQPLVFIETNIRTVYIHHFFADHAEQVSDAELRQLVEQTLDREHPREWYWALMDYGTHLKATVGIATRRSRHYTKQSVFEGSQRQIRGQLIRLLLERPHTFDDLVRQIADPRLRDVVQALTQEGLILCQENVYSIAT